MGDRRLVGVLAFCRRLVGTADEEGDGRLLELFARGGDEAAFTELVRRHGAMVFGVCLRVLRNPHDAEDAFQATFLVLARKSAALAGQPSVAPWLHTVSHRIALKIRVKAMRCRDVESRAGKQVTDTTTLDTNQGDVCHVLDEELGRLPEKYRAPLVLCYLEGKTNEEAARQLGWTKGTVSGRLARARDLLRGRLGRRGVTLPAVGLATLIAGESVTAGPPVLSPDTVRAAITLATGPTSAVPAPIAALADGVLRQFFLRRAAVAVSLLLGICLVGGAMAVLAHRSPSDEPPPRPVEKGKVEAPPPVRPRPLPKDLVAAWEKAGAESRWFVMNPIGWVLHYPSALPPRSGAVPGFAVGRDTAKKLKELPVPESDFALHLPDPTPEALQALAGYSRLTTLVLAHHHSPEALKELTRLRQIQVLRVDFIGDDRGLMKEIASLPNLTSLGIGGSVTDDGIKELARLKKLTSLFCWGLDERKMTGVGFKELVPLEHFTTLSLHRSGLNDDGLKQIAGLKQLRVLAIGYTKVTEKGFVHLARLKELRHLELTNISFTEQGLKTLAPLEELTTLHINCPSDPNGGWPKHLKQFKKLRYLDLDDTRVTEEGLKELAQFKHLTELRMQEPFLNIWTDEGIKHLAGLTDLTVLHLGSVVSERQMKELTPLQKLTNLKLGTTDAGIKELAAFPRLTCLAIGNVVGLSEDGAKELAKLKQLAILVVPIEPAQNERYINGRFTEEGVADLRKALPGCLIEPYPGKWWDYALDFFGKPVE